MHEVLVRVEPCAARIGARAHCHRRVAHVGACAAVNILGVHILGVHILGVNILGSLTRTAGVLAIDIRLASMFADFKIKIAVLLLLLLLLLLLVVVVVGIPSRSQLAATRRMCRYRRCSV